MSEDMKEKVRNEVRDSIKRYVNGPQEEDEQVDESFATAMTRVGAAGLGMAVSILGTLLSLQTMSVGGVAGSLLGGGAIFATGEAIARKLASNEFYKLFNDLQDAVAARDAFIKEAASMSRPEAEQFLKENKAKLKQLTNQQKKLAGKMRKVFAKESIPKSDESRILSSLTTRDRKFIEDLIDKAEAGLITLVDVR